MARAVVCALVVLVAGLFGSILGTVGCIMAVGAAVTGCVVYELEQVCAGRREQGDKEE